MEDMSPEDSHAFNYVADGNALDVFKVPVGDEGK